MRPIEDIKRRLADPRITTWLGIVTALVTVALLVLAALYWPTVSSRTQSLTTNSQIQGCRSQSNALVTQARTEFDVARAGRDTAATHLNLLIAEGLVDLAKGDRPALQALLPEIEQARVDVFNAEVQVVTMTGRLRDENARHQADTELSIHDVRAFLRRCDTFIPRGG